MMNEAVKSIMSTNLITVTPSHNLSQVRKLFMSYKIHHLPVVNGKHLVGILTTYDLWKNEIAPSDYQSTLVTEVMTRVVAKIRPEDKIGTAAEVFLDNRFHALPVVNDHNELVGLVSSFDVMLYEFKKAYPKPILFQHLFKDTRALEPTKVA